MTAGGRTRASFSVVLPNWEGEAWIERALSSMQLAARASGREAEIVVVDDASTDRSPEMIAAGFPRVRLLRNSRNVGFGESVNRGVGAAKGDLVVLLNNDLVVSEDFFLRLLDPFEQARRPLFGVSARTLSWDGTQPNHVCMAAQWREGRIQPAWCDPPEPTACLFAQGGSMACRRDVFLAFGGFDDLFAPGYWEDYDLCWRAARAGYDLLYEPRAVAFHVGGGSMIRRFGEREVYLMRATNHLVFEWLNLGDTRLLARHFRRLPRHVLREWSAGRGFGLSRALARASARWPRIAARRMARRRQRLQAPGATRRGDRRLLELGRGFTLSPSP